MTETNINKTLCKQCDLCEEFTYQRSLKSGKRKGELFKFSYCKGNRDIIAMCNWGPDITTNKRIKRTYVSTTKLIDGSSRHFEYFLKKDPNNIVLHLGDTLDLRMRKLREISKRCERQNRGGEESIFPGVGLTSWYKNNPSKAHGKKIWWTRVKIEGENEYLGNYYTELEAADAYYTKMEELGLEINRETEAHKIYQRWLKTREFLNPLIDDIVKHYREHDDLELEWYLDIIGSKIKK